MENKVLKVLRLIAEKNRVTGEQDQFVVVDNPDYDKDPTRYDPHVVIDVDKFERYLKDMK